MREILMLNYLRWDVYPHVPAAEQWVQPLLEACVFYSGGMYDTLVLLPLGYTDSATGKRHSTAEKLVESFGLHRTTFVELDEEA